MVISVTMFAWITIVAMTMFTLIITVTLVTIVSTEVLLDFATIVRLELKDGLTDRQYG